MDLQLKSYLDNYIKIQNSFHFISLGGSVPLMIYGSIPFRKIKDFDIISTQYVNKDEILYRAFGIKPPKRFLGGTRVSYKDTHFDLYINPQATYEFIHFEGYNLRVSPEDEIIFYKSKQLLRGTKKGIEDFSNIVENKKF